IDLTRKGTKKVTIIELLPKVGLNIGRTSRWVVIAQLRQRNVDMLTEATPVRITDKGVIYKQGGVEKLAEADTVVIAVGTRANDKLVKSLKKMHPSVYAIGDCVSPRLAIDAIYEGSKVAREI
ncbi:MAG: FAD-dependent oxidoreductase, partial [Deltaproteobacteria bacterium]|nr:FAD-dependent oxidoreductase [Deltaproteobacteria bacterium]